jgi:hypothetical protein
MAVLSSELSTYVQENWPILGIFKDDLISAPGWMLDGIELLGDRGYVIHYEHFVEDPEKSIQKLCRYLGLDYKESMLDYSSTPQPVGRFNDPTGINQHTRPSTGSVDKWKGMINDDQELYFARSYLDHLGEETITRLGYDYREIYQDLHARSLSTKGLYPWSIAIQPDSEWTCRQAFVSDLFLNKRDKGWLKGTLSTFKKHLKKVLKGVWYELSSPETL